MATDQKNRGVILRTRFHRLVDTLVLKEINGMHHPACGGSGNILYLESVSTLRSRSRSLNRLKKPNQVLYLSFLKLHMYSHSHGTSTHKIIHEFSEYCFAVMIGILISHMFANAFSTAITYLCYVPMIMCILRKFRPRFSRSDMTW